jgi:hypothetical protein
VTGAFYTSDTVGVTEANVKTIVETEPYPTKVPVLAGKVRCPVLSCARLRKNCFHCGRFVSLSEGYVLCTAAVRQEVTSLL